MEEVTQNIPVTPKPNPFATATLLSKVLAFILFVSLLFLGFYSGMTYQRLSFTNIKPTTDQDAQQGGRLLAPLPQETSSSGKVYSRIGECTKESCLFEGPEAVEGYGHTKGYYRIRSAKDYDGNLVNCDALVVREGTSRMIENFKRWVAEGNVVNTLDDENNLILSINLDGLSSAEANKIRDSKTSTMVTLDLIRKTPEGVGAPSCSSLVEIVGVK